MTSSCPKRRRAKRTPSSILVRTFCLRRCAAISATSPNQDGVEATDSAEVWMITDPSAILVICTSLRESVLFFLLKEAHFMLARYFLAARCAIRGLDKERHTGTLVDRAGNERVVFDIDGTRQAARQRALPKIEELPAPQRRLNQVCAPGYTGRKRGEVVRTRTVVSQAHSYHWLGSFGDRGKGLHREEPRRRRSAIRG